TAVASASPAATQTAPAAPAMTREFIESNRIVERYLLGRLPARAALDFEAFCRHNPLLLEELGLPQRIHSALRLLDAAGQPEPWQPAPKRFWERPALPIGLAAVIMALAAALFLLIGDRGKMGAALASLEAEVLERPLQPVS